MRNLLTGSALAIAGLMVCSLAAAAQNNAQAGQGGQGRQGSPQRPASNKFDNLKNDTGGPAPVHDLTGTWLGRNEPQMIKDVPPLTPLGQKMMALNKPEGKFADSGTNDPWYLTCDPLGFPRSVINQTRGLSFAQMKDKIVVLDQYNRVWREVWMDGRPLPTGFGTKTGPDPTWYGYSVGHWDADNVLVIQTSGSRPDSWVDKEGHPHSVNGIYTERYTRKDHNNLTVTVSIDDPAMYTKPWDIAVNNFKWSPDQDFEEQICVPSEGIKYREIVGVPAGDGSNSTN
jgi:hypothetical protein